MSLRQSIAVTVVAGDAGGAAALTPLLRKLATGPSFRVTVLAYGAARREWSNAQVQFKEVDPAATAAAKELERGADVLLTGTSLNGVDLEKRFVLAARSSGVPSVAVLDFWSNYRPRFADAGGNLAYLPDRICIMDERARREMLAEGFPSKALVITGQPVLDEAREFGRRFTPKLKSRIRLALGVTRRKLVVFCSQPISKVSGGDAASLRSTGYTEARVLDRLLAALHSISQRRREKLQLVVRPHPEEDERAIKVSIRDGVSVKVSRAVKALELCLAADLVTGMSSMLLMQAAVAGCRVLSLQPGLVGRDVLPSNRSGLSRVVYTEAGIEPAVEDLLYNPKSRAMPAGARTTRKGATDHILALLRSAARKGRHT